MVWLRPILLVAGALFIGLLVWWERRRPRQAPEVPGARTERSEPSLDLAFTTEVAQDTRSGAERVVHERAETPDTRDRELRRTPPVIGWSDDSAADDNRPADATVAEQASTDPLPELIVDWPTEDVRRIVTLRILPVRQDRLGGRELRQGLAACGFRHGQFGIFHLAGDDGRVMISAASLVRPGMLDPATMDFQRFAGINVFAVLPGPVSAELALQRLGQVAVEVASRVGGRVQDDSSAPFNAGEAGEWRRRCLSALEGAQANARQAD
jgi:FtsZ-interacting cell division protein ZipA